MIFFFDKVFSALIILLTLPFFLIILIILKMTGEGEIFFLQDRVGINGETFKLIKFATMIKNSPKILSGTVTLKDDIRVLPFGRFLRKTKINEFPQLLNVFLGHMSLVGPRPQTKRCFDVFPSRFQKKIIQLRPGLSGIGAIIFCNEENLLSQNLNPINFYDQVVAPYKGEVESWYVAHQNLHNYFLIIFLTVWVVISPPSNIVWRFFPDLPVPPSKLRKVLNYKTV